MDGIHDMGGMHGFGPIEIEPDEPVFHAPWEGRVLAICRKLTVPVPGGMRNNIERLAPAEYLRSSYYEKWLHARIKGLVDAGVITAEELAKKLARYGDDPDAPLPVAADADADSGQQPPTAGPMAIWSGQEDSADAPAPPRFAVGDQVRAKQIYPAGHTRLPRYIRGKIGRVFKTYRPQTLQDAEPVDGASRPQAVYAVKFSGDQLWGAAAEANSCVLLDMWESYLEEA